MLREYGVDMAQGYHLGRPVDLDQMLLLATFLNAAAALETVASPAGEPRSNLRAS